MTEEPPRLVRCEFCGREPAYLPSTICSKCERYQRDTEAEVADERGRR